MAYIRLRVWMKLKVRSTVDNTQVDTESIPEFRKKAYCILLYEMFEHLLRHWNRIRPELERVS